jgi:topoisomerase-4 subunit A
MSQLEPLMQQNFLEYASYVIVDRAIPDLRDGCKPVQRRLLHTLFLAEDGKFHKVANIIGESMKLHPHGDASIGEALVVLANKEYFIEKQGNYGNVLTGHSAAAARYIECRLTPLARDTLFNTALTNFALSYDGRREEPLVLPAKLPVVLMLGTEGIAVGMATKIMPHNFVELLEAQIKILQGGKVKLYPDFLHGGAIDVSEYSDGRGKVKVRATLESVSDKKVVVREIPFSTTTESLIASIENAIQKGKVKISSINDFTTDKVEIELTLARGTYADEVIPQLYAYTDCEVSISSNIVVIRDRHPAELTVTEVLDYATTQLRAQVKAELEFEMGQLEQKQHWLTLEQLFIENRVYKRIERATTAEKVDDEVRTGMAPYAKQFVRPLQQQDIDRLLELRIRRISAYDLSKNRQDIDNIVQDIKRCATKLRSLTKTTIAYLTDLIKRYGKQYPRRTRLETFVAIDRKKVARQNLKLVYDRDSGFFGTEVKGTEYPLQVSEYDLVLTINDQGRFRVMTAQSKVLVGNLLHCALFNPEEGALLTLVYRDAKKHAYAKKVHLIKFMRNREYALALDKQCRIDFLKVGPQAKATVRLSYAPTPRGRVEEVKFKLQDLELTSVNARGTKLAPKPVSKVRVTEP